MGRWSSEAYLLYVRTPVDSFLSVAYFIAGMMLTIPHLHLLVGTLSSEVLQLGVGQDFPAMGEVSI